MLDEGVIAVLVAEIDVFAVDKLVAADEGVTTILVVEADMFTADELMAVDE